jgi:hypothetical protein
MTPWKRTVALAAVGCLIAGAALAQQQIRPPNMKSTPQAPNTPLQAPSHWGPAVEAAEGAGDDPAKTSEAAHAPR